MMSDDLERLSDLAYSGEELLEGLLRARGDAEIDTLMERVQRWSGELIAAGEAHDRIRLRFRMIRPTAEETARIWPLYPELRDDQRGYCNYLEAALRRLNAYLRRPDARPKGKGGNRRKYDDLPLIAKAHAIMEFSGTENKTAAACEAAKRFPELFHGDGIFENMIKRITRQM